MTLFLQILGGCILAVVLWHLYWEVFVPLHELRKSLRRLAERDFRPVMLHASFFRETSGHIRKIAEQLQVQDQQITTEEVSLRAVLSSMVEGVLIIDQAQRIRLINEPLREMFQLQGTTTDRFVFEVFRSAELRQAIEYALSTGHSRKIEVALPSGKHLEVYAGCWQTPVDGRSPGAVVVFHDVTAVKKLEAVRREFVANVSHEFRTPLAIINGYVETLMDGALDDRPMAEKFLKIMHKNGERLSLLIEDLLTVSRLEHRAVRLDFQPLNLKELLQHVLDRLEPNLTERKARVGIDWPKETPLVEGDANRLEQVISNLIENAIRHGPLENLRLGIRAEIVEADIEISFSDNGPGIPYQDQLHVFERFYRVQKDRSRLVGGSGLGLSIVKHVVQAHGGLVRVHSVPGAGATFVVSLPLIQSKLPEDDSVAGKSKNSR